jgi:rRNA processing protein Krr1/Pno1
MGRTKNNIIEYCVRIIGTKEEIEKIKRAFDDLKVILNQPKGEVYRKALEWIAEHPKIKAEFIRYVQEEKAKILEAIKKKRWTQQQ